MTNKKPLLEIKNLSASVAGKEIIKNLSLTIFEGQTHVIMGPNGAGKSTLSHVLTGKPGYEVTSGSITFKGKNLLDLSIDERANEGLFLIMQYPVEIPGVSFMTFLKYALNAKRKYLGLDELSAPEFIKLVQTQAQKLAIDKEMLKRAVNVGFSGGEKKRMETLQMALLKPALSILDEADSGLDIDALKVVSKGINDLDDGKRALLIITHHQDLLEYIKPDFVHVFAGGRIIKTGDKNLALELEAKGYTDFIKEAQC
ncbi:MAG: Fe-S cluster assembly ATPase SufC [Alphaproteobacteria bacterium]|nr:Fe-S cluster assembly ATPase SufC [Alphaproteobacteria bacterium]